MADHTRNRRAGDAAALGRLAWRLNGSDTSANRRALQHRVRCPFWERQIRRLHALGPRPLAELLAEIGTATGCPEIVAERVATYAALPPETVRALGADRFPSLPIYEVVP